MANLKIRMRLHFLGRRLKALLWFIRFFRWPDKRVICECFSTSGWLGQDLGCVACAPWKRVLTWGSRQISNKAAAMCIAIVLLNILDAFCTLRHLAHGAFEVNPFMRWALNLGPLWFFNIKHQLAVTGVLGICYHSGTDPIPPLSSNEPVRGGVIDNRELDNILEHATKQMRHWRDRRTAMWALRGLTVMFGLLGVYQIALFWVIP